MKRITKNKVELLAPVGNWECLRAAVANGADAVFFGVEKFNARVRAKNFQMDELPTIMAYLHKYNVRGYVTFNILVFENELHDARKLVRACIDAGVDALIVQDMGLVEIIREMSPDFPIHGSTQMTVTSAEAVEFLKPFDIEVVVLGRENNLKQIKTISDKTKVPLEVFVHGALCVSYSGQCLTSEMWGGRSANRGECAQACRLPYDLIVDGERKEMGNIAYVLSPKDLAAIELVPELIEAGVYSFKIEGRMKSPEYVANVVSKYRKAIDEYLAGRDYEISKEDLRELEQSFSRGFTYGFLKGTNHKTLLDGTYPKSRGVLLGTVKKVLKDGVLCDIQAPLKRGDGIVFDAGRPDLKEEGGRVYDIRKQGSKLEGEAQEGLIEIVAGRHDVNLTKVHVGDKIWKTSDQELERRLQKTFETELAYRSFPLKVTVTGKVGKPLVTQWFDEEAGLSVTVQSSIDLEEAQKRPLTSEYLAEQFGRLGGTIYELAHVELHVSGDVIVPVKELNSIRREAVELLVNKRQEPRKYTVNTELTAKKKQLAKGNVPTKLISLCRSLEQIEASCKTDVDYIYADFEFTKDYPQAVEVARKYAKPIALATPRIHMPGEQGVLNQILRAKPDAILVRSLGAVHYYLEQKLDIPLIGDFSLNVANHKAVEMFLERGLDRITPSYDLNIQQMVDLLGEAPAQDIEVVIHQHLPMYHTEHCVYCTFLSEGTDYTNCGRPCEEHRISLEDRVGFSHPVRVDVGCRNTVFNAIEQSGAEYISNFLELGVSHYRVEFLEETGEKVTEVLSLYREALQGKRTGTSIWKSLKATNQLGVTRGQLIK
ncbi:U32 family peptidase [Anaerobacillus alkaliphilus]|uniref:U32 family peptidase n=1 Tax=Anaerobacillus alkaliphilus TaxID=1548597 RepID=A0A4Q0VZU1_9BACI|nr:U32 family peptidase [Anaerobacillus alkaliphilus]RXJ04101.1 U32 family peptidase [Anaerobacillus alkaliphilus]